MKKILIIISCFFLTGCFDYVELNKIAIVSSIGIDKVGDEYEVTVQILNSKEDENSEGSQVTIYSEKANTIIYALRKISLKSPRKLNGSHISKLVLSKEVAEENIINVIDDFERLGQAREEIDIVIIDNTSAKNVLSVLTETENVPAEYVKMSLESGYKYTALTYPIKVDEFVSTYLKKYIDPVIPVIEVDNYKEDGTTIDNINTTNPITKINVTDKLGITKDGKVVDYIEGDEIYGYNFLNNNINNAIIEVKCDSDNYSSISIKSKTKYETENTNNKYVLKYIINITGEISEYNCEKDLTNDNKDLENRLKNKIKSILKKVLDKDTDSNYLGIKRKIYLDNSKYSNEDITVKYEIKVDISKKGQLNNSIKGEKNE